MEQTNSCYSTLKPHLETILLFLALLCLFTGLYFGQSAGSWRHISNGSENFELTMLPIGASIVFLDLARGKLRSLVVIGLLLLISLSLPITANLGRVLLLLSMLTLPFFSLFIVPVNLLWVARTQAFQKVFIAAIIAALLVLIAPNLFVKMAINAQAHIIAGDKLCLLQEQSPPWYNRRLVNRQILTRNAFNLSFWPVINRHTERVLLLKGNRIYAWRFRKFVFEKIDVAPSTLPGTWRSPADIKRCHPMVREIKPLGHR